MTPLERDQEIEKVLRENKYYPERLMLYLWDWGCDELEGIEEPDAWQLENAAWIGAEMRKRRDEFEASGTAPKIADLLASGRGPGKSADIGMLVVCFMAAWPDAKISVLANTGDQLATKTWPAVRTWLRRSRVAHWFEINAAIMFRVGARDSWFCTPITWSLENPQASAGQHNLGSVNIFFFDEMSEIPPKIIEIALAGLVTGMAIAIGRGNPTLADGVMADALNGKYAFAWWHAISLDSRNCRFPNKAEIAEMVEHYGEDSDYVRVWVRGLPPKTSLDQYFPNELIAKCQSARPKGLSTDALIGYCDLAWGGSDPNLVGFTHGLDAWSLEPIEIPGEQTRDPEVMVSHLASIMGRDWKPAGRPLGMKITHLFMDAAGSANVIARRLGELGFKNITLVNFAGHSLNMKMDRNIRSQIIRGLKEYMEAGAGIGSHRNLEADLKNIQKIKTIPLQFEDKDLIRKRLKRSTDRLDGLALSRYMPVVLEEPQQQFDPRDYEPAGNMGGMGWMR